MDRRLRKNKKAVFDAFTELLSTKSYSEISIQEIIEKADIGRSTFYSHFRTKSELLKTLCDDIFEHVFAKDLSKEENHDFSVQKDLRSELTHILYHLQEKMTYLSSILRSESGETFVRTFKNQIRVLFENELKTQENDGIPMNYLINSLICDFTETVRWWSINQRYSPEEIVRFFLEKKFLVHSM